MRSVLASYTLSLAVFIPTSGWMADRFGTRRVFASAIGLFTSGSFLCGKPSSPNTPSLRSSSDRVLTSPGKSAESSGVYKVLHSFTWLYGISPWHRFPPCSYECREISLAHRVRSKHRIEVRLRRIITRFFCSGNPQVICRDNYRN